MQVNVGQLVYLETNHINESRKKMCQSERANGLPESWALLMLIICDCVRPTDSITYDHKGHLAQLLVPSFLLTSLPLSGLAIYILEIHLLWSMYTYGIKFSKTSKYLQCSAYSMSLICEHSSTHKQHILMGREQKRSSKDNHQLCETVQFPQHTSSSRS